MEKYRETPNILIRYSGWVLLGIAGLFVAFILLAHAIVSNLMGVVANRLFQLFENDTFPLVLAAAILVIALVMWIGFYLIVVMPRARTLRTLRNGISQHNEQSFSEKFHEISQKLESNWLIGHAWKEFRETLVEPENDHSIIQNTTRPHTFINYNCAQDKSRSLRFMPHIPNYFVGIGLLLTFVGLVAALYFANNTVSGDANEAVDGLRDLLAAATFKFWTSIAGLLSSIVLSIAFRSYSLLLEGEFSELCETIEQKMGFATPQRIFFDVRDTIQEQLAETKKINTEIAMSIADGVGNVFREEVPGMLAEAMRPLVDAVQESSEKVREGATGGLDNMVNSFTEKLEGSSGQHLKHMSETLQQLTESLESMQGTMDSSGNEFSRRLAEGSERLDATMREVAESMRLLVEGMKQQIGEAGQVFGAGLRESLERLSQQSEEMAERLAKKSQDASIAFSEDVSTAARALSESAKENAETSVQFAAQLRNSLGESAEGVSGSLDRVGKSLAHLQNQLTDHSAAMSTVSERSQETARSMVNASQSIKSGLEPFQRVGQSLNESAGRLDRSATTMAEKIGGAVNVVESVSKDLSAVSNTLETAWESYQKHFQDIDKDLEAAFNNLQSAVENQQRNVQDFVNGLDKSFSEALSSLSGGVSGMAESIEEFSDAVGQLNGSGKSMNRLT